MATTETKEQEFFRAVRRVEHHCGKEWLFASKANHDAEYRVYEVCVGKRTRSGFKHFDWWWVVATHFKVNELYINKEQRAPLSLYSCEVYKAPRDVYEHHLRISGK
ncbi:MAG TPA: hypothetical protein VJJ82_01690 [Candidatus Nanoarchaeia archaeon]|nr:hypothetical protein [Candidatus Nanoarchaeia archaeon]